MRHCTTVALAFAGMAAFASLAHAADLPSPNNTVPQPDASGPDWITQWFQRVDAAQASQPHWMTPLVTVTPRLEEEVRYDQSWQTLQNGGSLDNYGGGKGLELIPTTTNEVIIGVPPYEDRQSAKPASGFADWPVILIKQRLLSANESHGNYILTAFLAASAPTGVAAFTNNAWLITPTIAGGVGFGDFDVQATFGAALPTAYESTLGTAFATNVALQYHFATYFWPELEFNDTYWDGGLRSGKNQLFITPGVVLGRFQLPGRAKLSVGVGYQVALGPVVQNTPVMTPTYNHEWLMSARVSF